MVILTHLLPDPSRLQDPRIAKLQQDSVRLKEIRTLHLIRTNAPREGKTLAIKTDTHALRMALFTSQSVA